MTERRERLLAELPTTYEYLRQLHRRAEHVHLTCGRNVGAHPARLNDIPSDRRVGGDRGRPGRRAVRHDMLLVGQHLSAAPHPDGVAYDGAAARICDIKDRSSSPSTSTSCCTTAATSTVSTKMRRMRSNGAANRSSPALTSATTVWSGNTGETPAASSPRLTRPRRRGPGRTGAPQCSPPARLPSS